MGRLGSLQEIVRGDDSLTRRAAGRVAGASPRSVLLGRDYRRHVRALEEWRRKPEVAWERAETNLRKIVAHAWCESAYYRQVLNDAFGCSAIHDLRDFGFDDLVHVPILARSDVLEHRDAIRVPFISTSYARTGGSSGVPLELPLDRDRASWEWAHVREAWWRAGWTFRDWRFVLRAFPAQPEPIRTDRLTRELRLDVLRLGSSQPRTCDRILQDSQQRFVHGYPSAITRYIAEVHPSVRGVFLASEPATPDDRAAIRERFPHAEVVHFFGLTERCLFGLQSRDGSYSLAPTYGLGEVVGDDGCRLAMGEVGRLLGTSLNLKGFPLLRYDTGDIARSHTVTGGRRGIAAGVHAIRSRKGPALIDRNDRVIPAATMSQLRHMDICSAVLFVQEEPGRVVVQFGSPRQDVWLVAAELSRRLEQVFGESLDITVEHVAALEATTSSGKRQLIRSSLPK